MRTPTAITALLGATLLVSAAALPNLGRKLGKTEIIKSYGYALRIPEKWKPIPAPPGVNVVVGSWRPDMEEVERKYDIAAAGCAVTIVRFPIRPTITETTRVKPEGAEKSEEHSKSKDPLDAASLREFFDLKFSNATARAQAQEITAGKGKDKLKGQLFEFTYERSYICIAIFNADGVDWGVMYESLEEYYQREWQKIYLESIKSFYLFPAEGEIATGPVDRSKMSRDELRKSHKASIAGNPGWWSMDTDNYVILTNSKSKGFIKEIGRQIEIMRNEYEKLFPPLHEVDAISVVRVFSEQSEYHQYGGPRSSAGYWNDQQEELVLFENFDSMSKEKGKENALAVMYHEAFHQYIFYAVGDVAPHSWFNEGHGDYFAGHMLRGNKPVAQPFEWRTSFLKSHFQQKKNLIPIRSLVRLPQSEYYNNAGLKYSQGWALIYFLRSVTKNKLWQEIPNRYFAHLRDNIAVFQKTKESTDDDSGESVPGIPGVKVYSFRDEQKVQKVLDDAVDAGFKGVDYEELDAEFLRWLTSVL